MRILVIGHTGAIGSAVATALAGEHEVIGASRSGGEQVDVDDDASVRALFDRVGDVDAVVTCVGSVPFKPLAELSTDDFLSGLTSKAVGQIRVVQLGTPHLRDGGSFTLTSGVLDREPIATGAAAAAANGALATFTMAAAAELPRGIRINCVSPTVLAEATHYHAFFPGFIPAPADRVAQAFVKSVLGVATGQVYPVD